MKNYVIGIDGGGTNSSVMISDMEKTILESFSGGSINYNGSSKSLVDSNLYHIFETIREKGFLLDDCLGICIGAAGISNPIVKILLMDNILEIGYQCPAMIVADVETAFTGALENPFGIILISGTGSVCFGKDQEGNTYRSGGYGYLIDDAGSGYAIARDILSAVVQAHDERNEPTCLTKLVYDYININTIEELISFVYHPERNKKEIAELSVLIEKAYALEDNSAIKIVKKCASELVDLTSPIVKHLGEDINLAVSGGVLLNNEVIYREFCSRMNVIHPGVRIMKPIHNAAYGAVTLALGLIHGKS